MAHRRDEDPIGKRQVPNRERIKQAGHGPEVSNPNATDQQSSNLPIRQRTDRPR